MRRLTKSDGGMQLLFILCLVAILYMLTPMICRKVAAVVGCGQDTAELLPPPIIEPPSHILHVAMVSIARSNDSNYLAQTIDSIAEQLEVMPLSRVLVLHPKHSEHQQHKVFHETRFKYRSSNQQLLFIEQQVQREPWHIYAGKWRQVRQLDLQMSRDFMTMLQLSDELLCRNEHFNRSYVMIMEDDFTWCRHAGLHMLEAMMSATKHYGDWLAMRVSFGANGMIVPCRDISTIINAIDFLKYVGPIDWILHDWFQKNYHEAWDTYGPLRMALTYKFNLMEHIGVTSTRGDNSVRVLPLCYDILATSSVNAGNFDIWNCMDYEFTPCPPTLKHLNQAYYDMYDESTTTSLSLPPTARSSPHVPPPHNFQFPPGSMLQPVLASSGSGAYLNSAFHDSSPRRRLSDYALSKLVFKGRIGESCDTVCEQLDKRCVAAMLPLINTCEILAKFFPCKEGCIYHLMGYDENNRNPCYAVDPNAHWWGERCFVSTMPSMMNCEGRFAASERICPCL